MKKFSFILLISLVALVAKGQINDLPRAIPESEGVPSRALINLFDSLHHMPQTDIHSMIVMRNGKVVGEFYPKPFAPEYQHTQYSSSKTLVSLAVGLAIDENRLRLDDRVVLFFPDILPDTISSALADMRVEDLLTMRSGIKPDWGMRGKGRDWCKMFLAKPVVNAPGEVFAYDSMVTYMLSAIVQKVTGMKVLDYLKEKLFNKMNIEVVNWEESPEGINSGGWGLHIQSESLAKIGQMWLDGGLWNGEQLISKEWIEKMGTRHANGGDFGYGYQTWMCAYPGAVRADGALGQYVIVVPDKRVVIVLTEASFTNGKPQRNLIWNNFLPALSDGRLTAGEDYDELLKREKGYQLPVAVGKSNSPLMKSLAGKKIIVPENKYGIRELSFKMMSNGAEDPQFRCNRGEKVMGVEIVRKDGSRYVQPFGYGHWTTAEIAGMPPYSISPIEWHRGLEGPFYGSGSYGWEKNSLNLTLHYVNWVTTLNFNILFDNGKAIISITNNYAKNKVHKLEAVIE